MSAKAIREAAGKNLLQKHLQCDVTAANRWATVTEDVNWDELTKEHPWLLTEVCTLVYRAVCFVFERARAPRHFLLGEGHPLMKLQNCTGAFQGHEGNDQGIRRQSPLLPP